jgi:hypothetical protein
MIPSELVIHGLIKLNLAVDRIFPRHALGMDRGELDDIAYFQTDEP